jgi:hypothetical protein
MLNCADRLGHADVKITLREYTHVLPKHDDHAADEVQHVTKSVADHCQLDPATAGTISGAARQLWDAMADLGWVDSYGGVESARLIPAMVAFARSEAKKLATD